MGFNLTKNNVAQKSEVGYEFELKMPGTGDPTGAFITVRGDQSKVVKEHGRKTYNALQAKANMARKRGKDPEEITLEDAEDMSIESAAMKIISWRGIEEGEGKSATEVPFSVENAQRILREHQWIREQVTEEASQLLNFLKS